MPLFRVTKKLADALKLKLPKEAAAARSRQHEWFADLFYVERRKCVVWVHGASLLGFVRPAVTAAELRDFHALFRYEFRTVLASMGLPESLFERFDVYGPELYAATNDRAVVGSMLDYRKMFTFGVEHEGGLARANVRAINVMLSNTPMSVLGGDCAVRVVRRVEAMH